MNNLVDKIVSNLFTKTNITDLLLPTIICKRRRPKDSKTQATKQIFLSDQVSCRKNGRADWNYERWSWEAKACHIPRFNGANMLERQDIGSTTFVDVESEIYKVFRPKNPERRKHGRQMPTSEGEDQKILAQTVSPLQISSHG